MRKISSFYIEEIHLSIFFFGFAAYIFDKKWLEDNTSNSVESPFKVLYFCWVWLDKKKVDSKIQILRFILKLRKHEASSRNSEALKFKPQG